MVVLDVKKRRSLLEQQERNRLQQQQQQQNDNSYQENGRVGENSEVVRRQMQIQEDVSLIFRCKLLLNCYC